MRTIVKLLCLCIASCVVVSNSFAAPPQCKKFMSLGSFIYKNSAPLRRGGIGTPIVGFRREPTLICNTRSCSRRGTTIYDNRGTRIGGCPWTSAHGHVGGRFRCTMQTSSLRRSATRAGTPAVFFTVSGSTCVKIPDAGRCYGSSKGLCNQTIR